ncbi:MAG: pseudouridine synthase [Bacteroidia bacterium]|nr:pseudouridine synthase [Bacteroidia bacterium]
MEQKTNRYFIINKPYKMVSQFVSPDHVRLLGDLDYDFPEGTHAIGRLDNNSEGLLILTTNKRVTKLLFESDTPHKRTYVIQVEKVVSSETLQKLRTGISIRVKGGGYYTTSPCDVEIIEKPANLPDRKHAFREDLAQTWLSMTLTEGKFHQIRKMVADVYHPCKRLIRVSIEGLELGDIPPGGVKEIEEEEFFEKLKIDNWRTTPEDVTAE